MLSPRLTNCPECANIPSLLKKIDCRLAELGNNLYNNISYMLNKPVPANDILQLIGYRRILTHKYCNPNYVHEYSVAMIASRVIRLTLGCVSKCNEPERCLEDPCDITIVPNPTTTSTSTLPITTTTTSSSSTSTTTSTSTSSSTTTTTTTDFPLSSCSVLVNEVNGNIVGYNTSTNQSTVLANLPLSPDVANTATKMWLYYNIDSIIKEYNIKLNPWTLSYNRDISYPVGVVLGAGLTAKDDVTLITTNNLASPSPIIKINITGSTAIVTSTITSLDPGYYISGDILITTTGKIICTANSGSVYKLFQYDEITGTKEVEVDISAFIGLEYPLGLAENNNKLYVLCSLGSVYEVNLNSPYTLTLVNVGDFTVSGASQSPECATVNLIVGSTTTTTSSSSTSTSTTSTSTSTSTTTSTSSSTSTTTSTTLAPCVECIPHDVTIGTQTWAGCNLNVDTYLNGDPIPEVTDPSTWIGLTTGAWCYDSNNSANGPIYGKLYNWAAVTDPRGLAPVGYHVPTKDEFITLLDYIDPASMGGTVIPNNAGGPLKEIQFCHWESPNEGATNSTGFTALPGGGRETISGVFFTTGELGIFWSSTGNDLPDAFAVQLINTNSTATLQDYDRQHGFSVRCIKD